MDDNVLNLIYNLADMLYKVWFCLAIWHAAKQELPPQITTARYRFLWNAFLDKSVNKYVLLWQTLPLCRSVAWACGGV